MSFRHEEEHILSFFCNCLLKDAKKSIKNLLDAKLPQQTGSIVAIYDVVFLSEVWHKLTMTFSVEGHESSRLKQIVFFES